MKFRLSIYLISLLVISSCGGGGGGGGGSPEPQVPSASITMSISSPQIYISQDLTINWSTSNATSCTASGDWSGTKALSGTETLSFTSAGQKSFTLTCQNSEGNETSRTVTSNVIGNAQGIVVGINGISSANVVLDINSNYAIDDGEPSSTSDGSGIYELPDDPQDMISFGGGDDLSGVSFTNLSLSHKSSSNESRVISSLTALDYANTGDTDLNTLLNLDSSIDIYSSNPISALNESSSLNKYYETNAQVFVLVYSLQAYVNEINASSLDSSSFFQSFYTNVKESYDSGIQDISEHIETSSFINNFTESVLTANGLDPTASSLVSILETVIKKISVRNNSSATEAISNFATGTFISDIVALANGSIDSSRLSTYTTNLNSLIASDQNVDATILDQSISLEDDSILTNEDNGIEFPPLSNDTIDAGNDYYGLSISVSDAQNGQVSVNDSNIISYIPNENYFGLDSFTYSVNVDGTSATANVDVEVVSVNDPPKFKDFITASSINENTLVVLTVVVEDIENDPVAFSLSGSDSDKLSISTSGAITFNSNPDFESPNDANSDNQYDIIVEASDGSDVTSEALSISILDVENEGNPIIEGLASQAINENEDILISFTVTDPQNDSISYSLTGIDSNLFSLTFDGENALLTSSQKDYESPEDSDSNNRYIFNVNFADDLNTTSQEVEITITNINDNSPVITSNSNFSADENQATVGRVLTEDADYDDISFSLSGTDASALYIDSSGNLFFNSLPNYEEINTYNFIVTATDGLYSANQNIVVNINNVNDAPLWKAYTSYKEVDENISNANPVLSFEVSDEDDDLISFSLSGDDSSLFAISGRFPGNVVFLDDNGPDFENPQDLNKDNTYNFFVTATDGTVSINSTEISIKVNNINDNAPIFADLVTSVEVTNGQSNVFDISTSDADGDEVTLGKIGTDEALFSIIDNSLSFTSAPDFSNPQDNDGDNVYKLSITAEDGSYTTISEEISITVLEVNNPPVISGLESSYTLSENTEDIASFSVSDPENNSITVGVSGDDSTNFIVVDNVLKYSGGLNFENPTDSNADNVYELEVFADDGFNRTTQNVQLTITNVDEGPEFNITEEISIEENVRLIAAISINDPENDSFTWSITGGDDSGIMSLVNVSGGVGNLRFNSFTGVDYENPSDADTDNVYLVQLTATEDKANGLSTVLDLRITINDIKDTWSISGTLFSNPLTAIDGDVPDIIYYPPTLNNDIDSAQVILNPTDVIGHIGDNSIEVLNIGDDGFCIEDPDNPGFCDYVEVFNEDPVDWYKISGAPNLLLTLSIEGLIFEQNGSFYCCTTDGLNADLFIYDENGDLADFTYTSNSTDTFRQIVLPESGTFYAVIRAVTGHTKYVLTLGSNVTGVSSLRDPNDQYADSRFISYIPFGGDFDVDNYVRPEFDLTLSDLHAKIIESNKIMPRGLRVIDFDLEREFNNIFGENYLIESNNLSQVRYLKHWKLLQYYRQSYPKLNLELDFKAKAHFTNDPYWPYQWGLSQIGLDSVLTTIGQDVKDVAVAVIDTGSPEISSSAWTTSAFLDGGFDFVPFTNAGDGDGYDSDPTDTLSATDSHGTHVATTISALNDNLNINGFGIQTVPIRALGQDGTGYRSDIVQGMLYAAGLPNGSNTVYSGSVPIKVINMSLGSTGGSCGSTYQNAINDVYDRGISIVSSSGNEAQEAPGFYGYPASCNNVISVGATDYLRDRAYYSTYNDQVDIAAPGGDVTADINADGYSDGILAFSTNEDLNFYQGTSMASPHVSGAIAILYALVPTLQPFQVDGLLADGHLTDDVGDEGKDDEFGYGALNLQKAVNRIISDEGLDFTYATVDTTTFNMGLEVNNFDFNINKVGDGELSVVSIESAIPSAITINSATIDSEGFGNYTVSLDRSSLPDGLYQSNVKVTFSNENSVVVSVSFQVGPDREIIPVPTVYLTLRDSNGESVVYDYLGMPEGTLAFTANDIPPGDYYWIFSTVIDDFITDPGEFYNYYPDISNSDEYFNLGENDIENSAVTLRVNKSTAGFSLNRQLVFKRSPIKLEDFNRQIPRKTDN